MFGVVVLSRTWLKVIFFTAISEDEYEPDTCSIHSYDGNVAELSTDKLAVHELGETPEVRFRTSFSILYDVTR